jgi:hypothetical protein
VVRFGHAKLKAKKQHGFLLLKALIVRGSYEMEN